MQCTDALFDQPRDNIPIVTLALESSWECYTMTLPSNFIRFDGRALLDMIREYDKRFKAPREKSDEEEELEELVNFERYRDLIKQRRRGCRYLKPVDHNC
jgi:hypothetical protein